MPAYKLITPSVVSERLKIRGSLARAALRELFNKGKFDMGILTNNLYSKACLIFCFYHIWMKKGLIKCVSKHSSQDIYTRAMEEQPKDEKDDNKPQKQEKQKKQSKAEKAAAKAEAAEENA